MKSKPFASSRVLHLGIAFLLLVAPCLSSVGGAQTAPIQDTNAVVDLHPLRPPDTSSPRDTLRNFLTNVDKTAEAWRRGTMDNTTDRAWMSALLALDFSRTPDGDSWSVRSERALLLKEILDRIEVPRDKEIPGDAEVAKDGVTRWTIPNTRLTLVRTEHGPRAGDFVFSASSW
jgi:MscS family membrane protein